MDYFGYVMALISILVGLALTHVLGALGSAVHRLRGHGAPIRLEAVYLLWVGYVLTWLVSFWWWEFKLHDLAAAAWSYGLYLFLIGYAVMLYLMAVILVPKDMEGVHDTYAYFMAGRRWFFGVLLLCLAIDFLDSWVKGEGWALRPVYVVSEGLSAAACILAGWSDSRRVQFWTALAMFAYQLEYTWQAVGILGTW